MVEPIMYLAIGFLVSMLFGLMIVPLVHNRAVRLTTKRMEAATPLSMAEIQADKDQLRAEFAMSARRLEMSVDQLKSKTTSQLAELGKKSDAINRMKLELGEKNATIFSLEARDKAMREQLRATEEEFTAKTEALRGAEHALKDKQTELAKLNAELSDRSVMADSRQVELVAVRAQIDELKNRVTDAEKEFATTQARLQQERGDSEKATRELGEARSRVENLSQRVTDLDRQLILQVKEAEMLGNRVNDLEGRLATQGKLLAERDYENKQLRRPMRPPNAPQASCVPKSPHWEAAANRQRWKNCGPKRRRSRNNFASRATNAPSCSATSTPSSSRLKAHGRPSAWRMRCCANASTTSPPKSQNSRCSSRGRTPRSRPCWQRNRRSRRWRRDRPMALSPLARPPAAATPKAAGRSRSASGRCSPTPPAPASSNRPDASARFSVGSLTPPGCPS